MLATRLPLVSPLARPPSTLLRTSFDTLLYSYSGLLTVPSGECDAIIRHSRHVLGCTCHAITPGRWRVPVP
jgi:hypothetical protein